MPFVKYSLLIYSTHVETCIFHHDWQATGDSTQRDDVERLVFGLQYSLRRTAAKMSPNGKPGLLSSLTTSGYKMHFFQTVTGYMFVLLTGTGAANLRGKFQSFFNDVFLPNVVMNPLYELNTQIDLPVFKTAVDKFNWER
jgi:hypothetical protein